MADLRIVDAPLLSTVKGTEKIPTGGEGNFSVSVNQVADFAKLKWFLATEEYVDNAVGNVQADLNLHKNSVSNPHGVTKVQVGLGNVDNTADLDKPLSNATQSAIITANSGKADKSYVDSQDQLKADKNTVEASLLLKADKVDLTASKIASDSNQTQQDINDFGGARWYSKSGGYDLGATVKLENGDTVKSTIDGNTNDPNVDMSGWYKPFDKFISVLDFKITGDGSDESSKFNLAMNRARSRNMPLDLAGFIINTGLNAVDINVKIQNGKLKGKYQFNSFVDLRSVELEIITATGFYIKGTPSNIIKFPKLKDVKITYAVGVAPSDAFSLYAEYTEGLQIIGSDLEVIQLINCPNYRIIRNVLDGKMRNNNELIHASINSKGGIIALNTLKNSLDNIVDLYSSGAETIFTHNQIENCGNRLGTVMELKNSYSNDPANSSNANNGYTRSIIISENVFKNCKATHAVNTSIINIYSIDSRTVPAMTVNDYISDIIIENNIFDGFDTSGISTDIRLHCISANSANNIKIRGNIAKNIPKSKLTDTSSVVFLQDTNDCDVVGNSGCVDQSSGLAIQSVNNNLKIDLNNFKGDVTSTHIPKHGLYLNRFTGSVETVLNNATINGYFEGTVNSVLGNSATINESTINGQYVNNFDIGNINDSIVDNFILKLKNGTVNASKFGGSGISSGNTFGALTISSSSTGVGTALLLSNMQQSTVKNLKTKDMALSVSITGANSLNLDIEAPKSKNVESMFNFDASVPTQNRATINLYGLTATKPIDTAVSIPAKSENIVYITGATGFTLGMTLATSYSTYANGVVFNSIISGANTIEVHIINNTNASVTVPVGFIKVRST